MAYIIENAHVVKGEKRMDLSLLAEGDRIISVRQSFDRYKHIRMNADQYIMTPTHVLLDFSLPLAIPFENRRDYFTRQFLLKGCTTVLAVVPLRKEAEVPLQLKKFRSRLLDSPVDFIIGAQVPVTRITPEFMRRLKKERIPAVFIEIESKDELVSRPWGWIKEAMFPYRNILIPIFKTVDPEVQKTWKRIISIEKLSALPDELDDSQPLNKTILDKIGIFPKKSNLHQGGEVSYNFYLKDNETVSMVESELFSKGGPFLSVTVHKGKVVRAGQKIHYCPGFGEYVEIKTPSFFTTSN